MYGSVRGAISDGRPYRDNHPASRRSYQPDRAFVFSSAPPAVGGRGISTFKPASLNRTEVSSGRTITCESQNSHQTDSGSGFERLPRMCDPELLELPGLSVASRERDRLTHGPRHVGGQL